MTNGEKFKTAEERAKEFEAFCSGHICEVCPLRAIKPDCGASRGQFAWLELEADGAEPLPCPFCGYRCFAVESISKKKWLVFCEQNESCGYSSGAYATKGYAIAAHNRVARAVMADGKKEEK